MLQLHIPKIRTSRVAVILMLAFGFCVLASTTVHADSPTIVKIEEDWEVVIGTPDTNSTSPQLRAVTSETCDIHSTHTAFTLNHHTQPDFVSGGMQLQVWHGDELQESRSSPATALLHHTGEVIRWTQRMTLENDVLTYEIVNGTSESWGTFGGQGYLKISVTSGCAHLDSYQSSVSAENSEVGFAANRVETFGLREVRAYTSEGLLWTDTGAGPE